MKVHELKCWPEFFHAIMSGMKTFDLRFNDRGFASGDILVLREWCPDKMAYTGRYTRRLVSYITGCSTMGLQPNWVCMGLSTDVLFEALPND